MAPRGGGPAGPCLLSILSSLAFDGPFSIWTGTYHEEPQETAGAVTSKPACVIQMVFYEHLSVLFY